ncbi:MAG: caspase family protein [Gemmatimonadota bacterium]|nr:caspase family protein [Gemmatimonadota bacterium]
MNRRSGRPQDPHAGRRIRSTRLRLAARIGAVSTLLALPCVAPAVQPLGAQAVPQRLALVVTIGKYPAPEIYGYPQINAGNDAPLVMAALRSQGFSDADILLLADGKATRQGILDAFETHLLARARPGDVVVFHYSGHGHQVTDDNGDELDGYDEVLVPYGAPNHDAKDFPPGYAGEKHLRDDTLNALLTRLRAAVGAAGHVLVTIDACFSGSATRAAFELPVRGVARPIGPPAAVRGASGDLLETGASRGAGGRDLAPLVVISATDHDELDHEVWGPGRTPVGPLSLALSRTLPNVTAGMSYAAWFEQIRLVMAALVPGQTPQIEGSVDAEVLSGRVSDGRTFFGVRAVLGDSVAVIEGGTLAGIQPGARVAFYALGAGPGDAPFAQGEVGSADEVSADVTLSVPDAGGRIKASRAFLTEFGYGSLVVRVAADAVPDAGPRGRLGAALASVPNLALVDERPDVVLTSKGGTDGQVFLRTAADQVTLAGPFDPRAESDRSALIAHLRAYARNRYLMQVELRDPGLDVRLEVVPATHQLTSRGCVASDTTRFGARKDAAGWIFHKDDGYLLRLRNVGREAAYVAVLELSANDATQLFPNAELRVSDNRLAPGSTFLVRDLCFSADEPFGDYVLKLFATRDRLDFGPILEARGLSRGGDPMSYFEELVADAFRGTRSGVKGRAAGTGTTQAVTIKVVRR